MELQETDVIKVQRFEENDREGHPSTEFIVTVADLVAFVRSNAGSNGNDKTADK